MTDSSIHDKARAVVLAALMVLSVMVGSIAFSGGAAAATGTADTTLSNPEDGTVEENTTVIHNYLNTTLLGLNDNNSGQTVNAKVYLTNGANITSFSGFSTNISGSNQVVQNGNLTFTLQPSNQSVDAYVNLSNLEVAYPLVQSNTTTELRIQLNDSGGADITSTLATLTIQDDNSTPPSGLTIKSPTGSYTEYDPSDDSEDDVVFSYYYSENNPQSVVVELNGTGTTGNTLSTTVNESQYEDDADLKSFQLDISESFDTGSLSDGWYNATVRVTDAGGNTVENTTTSQPILINEDEDSPSIANSRVAFGSNGTNVSINLTYNASVTDVDAETLAESAVGYRGELGYKVYNDNTDTYKWRTTTVSDSVTNSSVKSGVVSTETLTRDFASEIPSTAVKANFTFETILSVTDDGAYSTLGGSQTETTGWSSQQSVSLAASGYTAPAVESVETNVGSNTATITFSRPVEAADGNISADDFAYHSNQSSTGATVINSVSASAQTTTVTVTFDNEVAVDDLGADAISVAENALSNPESGLSVSASTKTSLQDTTSPAAPDAVTTPGDITSNNEQNYPITVNFADTLDESVTVDIAVNGYNISAANSTNLESGSSNEVTFTPDVSAVNTGSFTIETNVTDAAGNGPVTTSTTVSADGPSILRAVVQPNNNSKVNVTFDEAVEAADGSQLTAANFTYSDGNGVHAASIMSASQVTSNKVVLTLNTGIEASDLKRDRVEVSSGEVYDAVGLTASSSAAITDQAAPSGIVINSPSTRVVKQSNDTLEVSYGYTENIPNGTYRVVVDLLDSGGHSVTDFVIDDSQYVASGVNKTVTLNLSERSVPEGSYSVRVVAIDSGIEVAAETTTPPVVINDDAPAVTLDRLSRRGNVAPGENTTVTFTLADSASVTSAEVVFTDASGNTVSVPLSGSFQPGLSGNQYSQTIAVPSSLSDNTIYSVSVEATDESGFTATSDSLYIDVNSAQPKINDVEANAGEDTVTVTFSEAVRAVDGTFSADDFAYQNVNNASANAVVDATQTSPTTVELRLDAEVAPSGLSADLVSVRNKAVADAASDPRYVSSSRAFPLEDTTAPKQPVITTESPVISPTNEENYTITVDTHDELTNVNLTVTDGNTTISNMTSTGSGGNVSGKADIMFLVDDSGSMSDEINTVRTELQAFAQKVGGPGSDVDFGVVTFADQIQTLQSRTSNVTEVQQSLGTIGASGATELNFDAINGTVSGSQVNLRPNAETVIIDLTDENSDTQSGTPSLSQLSDRMNATSTTYIAVSPDRTGQLEKKSLAAQTQGATWHDIQTFNSSVLVDDIGTEVQRSIGRAGVEGEVSFTIDASQLSDGPIQITSKLTDLAPTQHSTNNTITVTKGARAPLETSVSGDTLTVDVSANNLSAGLTQNVTVTEAGTIERGSAATHEAESVFSTELSASDFTAQSSDLYTATVTLPEDGEYEVRAGIMQEGHVGSYVNHEVVDTQDPHPTESTISQADDSQTEITVLFNEPIRAHALSTSDVSIEGYNGAIESITGSSNTLTVTVSGQVQTGTSPDITVASSSYTEAYGDASTGASDSSTVVHTDIVDLEAGSNFVSLPAASGQVDASTVVSKLGSNNVENIMTYDDGSWQTYNPDKPTSEQDFTSLEGGQGFIITLSNPAELDVNVYNIVGGNSAAAATPQSQQLEEGWNLVGQWQEGSQRTGDALATISDDVTSNTGIYGQATAGTYTYTTVSEFQPGEAYWVFVTEDTVYTESRFGA